MQMKTLCITGFWTVFCFPVFFSVQADYSGGDGSPENPFQITTFADITALRNNPIDWDKHFILMNDIDLDPLLTGKVFLNAVIAPATYSQISQPQGTPFRGDFNGNGYSIKNLAIQGTAYNGFFGWVGAKGRIRNLTIEGGMISGNRIFGAIAAYSQGFVIHCRAKNVGLTDVAPATIGLDAAGGLVGISSGTVAYCAAECTVQGCNYAGGLIGQNTGQVYCSMASGSITGLQYVGGLVGYNTGSIENGSSDAIIVGQQYCGGISGCTSGNIMNCYSDAEVTGISLAGGIAGEQRSEDYLSVIENCYANGPLHAEQPRGIVGRKCAWPACSIVNCFWNMETTGTAVTAGGGTGLTDAQTRDPQIFVAAGWDFADETENGLCDNWYSPPGRQYPKLSFQHPQKATAIPFQGKGTEEKPYLLAKASDLKFISGKPWLMDKHFRLVGDVDLADSVLIQSVISPVTSVLLYGDHEEGGGYSYGVPFLGVFDGSGYSIHNLFIEDELAENLGLFGRLENATVRNLNLRRACLYGYSRCGLLAGGISGGQIENCSVQGWISGSDEIGGLFGNSQTDINKCSFEGLVWGMRDSIGGLSGIHYSGAIYESCVSGSVAGRRYVGGLVGYVQSGSGSYNPVETGPLINLIERCYSKGSVTGTSSVGGLVGSNGSSSSQWYLYGQSLQNCYSHARVTGYSYAGGLIGSFYARDGYLGEDSYFAGQVYQQGCVGLTGGLSSDYSFRGSYYDKEWIGGTCLIREADHGRTTAQMKSFNTYQYKLTGTGQMHSWDFDTVWTLCEGTNYPRLRWQVPVADWVCPYGVQLGDFAALADCWMGTDMECWVRDIDQTGFVDAGELFALTENWLMGTEDRNDCGTVHFGFDEGAGNTANSNIPGLTATLYNMDDSAWQPGYFGKAIQFDGIDDSMVLESFKGIPGGAARSCSAWIKTSSPGGHIMSWGKVETGRKWVLRLDEEGRLRLEVGNANVRGASRVSDGQWRLVTAVLNPASDFEYNDTKNIELFVDGQRESVTLNNRTYFETLLDGVVEVGSFSQAEQATRFDGLMDEVKIVPYSLTADEIRQMIPRELVAHWKLDEGVGDTVYDAANHHDGLLKNMEASNWDPGEKALYFDGVDDYVEFPDFKGLTGGKTRTCCVWVKTSARGRQIITWGTARAGGKWIIRTHDDGRLKLEVGNGYRLGYRNIADGKWHHIAVIMDYDQTWPGVGPRCVDLIIDGTQEPLMEQVSSLIDTSADENVKLGVHVSNPLYYQGFMRDVRLYNYALTMDQIRNVMGLPEEALVAHWKLDEGQGMTAFDPVGGHHGVLMNMAESNWDSNQQSLFFDGIDDYIDIPDFQGITGSQPRTCCAWIKTQTPANQILTWGTVATGAKWVIRLNEEGKVKVEIGNASCKASASLADDQWHHIAVVVNFSDSLLSTEDIVIYVDGLPEVISECIIQYINTSAAQNVRIGVFLPSPIYFQGYMKDIRIYNYALDLDAIQAVINSGM
jgi:hypothetical protein